MIFTYNHHKTKKSIFWHNRKQGTKIMETYPNMQKADAY